MSYEKRALAIKTFRDDPTYRVLALSSVGSSGINLAFCRVIIFLVGCFISLLLIQALI